MLVETHVHLGDPQFDADREEVLRRAAQRGVGLLVEIADSPRDWDRALALARAHPDSMRCALGLHPYHADEWRPELAARLSAERDPLIVAVGEIGLDYFVKCTVPRDVQKNSFRAMLAAAADAKLPIVVHCRDAYADLIPILREFYARPPAAGFHGVIHCFSGTEADAVACRDLGFALGVDGPVTYPKNDPLRAALKTAGLACLVLETDSPYLPPQSSRGKRNEPAAVAEIGERLAAVFGIPAEELGRATTRNARALFRLDS
ncbi:MAG TPA: TatD family hydrolase [Elusimicrobiota bacterium]|nr:TatD family hydrolase [Elusimicrobiota bacterium]